MGYGLDKWSWRGCHVFSDLSSLIKSFTIAFMITVTIDLKENVTHVTHKYPVWSGL